MEAPGDPGGDKRTFVVHVRTPGVPVALTDLGTLERVELESLDALPDELRDRLLTKPPPATPAADELEQVALPQLTTAEARVAALATQGLSNKGIAAALCVRPRTVETHLTSVYRKLGIASRTELARTFHRGRA
jgi:DNA-binding NarL/FixJ family response regulator